MYTTISSRPWPCRESPPKQNLAVKPGEGDHTKFSRSPSRLSTYLDSVPQVLPEYKRLLCDLLFFLMAVLLRDTRFIFLGLFLLVKKTMTTKEGYNSYDEQTEPSHSISSVHGLSPDKCPWAEGPMKWG